MTLRTLLRALMALFAMLLATPAPGANQIFDSSGELIGASGVDVAGTLYDVSFLDGTCAALFSGCDESTDFAFHSYADATSAAQSLLDQVLIGTVDVQPQLTAGCEDPGECITLIPYSATAPFFVSAGGAVNSNGPDGLWGNTTFPNWDDFTQYPDLNFARFTLAQTAVPEPVSWVMMLLGFGTIGRALRRSRHRGILRA